MRPLLIGLLLVGLAACSEPATEPTTAPPLPSFSTTSTSVTVDFEATGYSCGDAGAVCGPLTFNPLGRYLEDTCTTSLTAHGGHGFLQDGSPLAQSRAQITLAAPVHAVRLFVGARSSGTSATGATISASDGSTILASQFVPYYSGVIVSADYTEVQLSAPGNTISVVYIDDDFSVFVYIDDVTLTTETGPTPSFTGFFQPVDNDGVLNIAKAGSAIPVKFSLGGDFGLDVLVKAPTASAIACPTGAGADAIEEVSASPSGLTYDAAADQYTYVWKTQSGWKGTCKQLHMPLSDGMDHTALFQFK
jgi:hypothetical protein